MISASIELEGEEIHTLFASEEKRLHNERGGYHTLAQDGKTIIKVSTTDSTALRAILNSICKILIVHDKMSHLVKEHD